MSSSYKSETVETTVMDAVSEAFGEFQALRDEMRETADNMESGGLGHTEKAQRALEAADTLDSFADNEPSIPDCAEKIAVEVTIQVPRRKGRGASRAVRLDNALANLECAKDAVETEMDRLREEAASARHRAEEHEMDARDAEADAADTNLTAGERETAEEQKASAEDDAAQAEKLATDYESEADDLDALRDELENAYGDASGGVEFPGFYG